MSIAPKVEGKTNPSHFKYALLGYNSTYPIIVSSEFDGIKLDRVVKLVSTYGNAIRYNIEYFKGTIPHIYTHRIILEPIPTPFIERKRRLNPNMK